MIKVENLHKEYISAGEVKVAIDNISFTVDSGELVAIVGKSGAGKSTLLHLLAGIDETTGGVIEIDDTDIININGKTLSKFRREHIGIILQDFALVKDFTVRDNVAVPLVASKLSALKKNALIYEVLAQLGIEDLYNKKVNKLSGGEKQRAAIARAIVNSPTVVLADEPTGALDVETGKQIIEILKQINKQGKTVIIVTHDMDIADGCDRKIEMSDGNIISDVRMCTEQKACRAASKTATGR